MSKDTSKIMEEINRMKDLQEIKEYSDTHKEDVHYPRPMDYLLKCAEKHGIDSKCFKDKKILDPSFAGKLISGSRKPNRNHLLMFALLGKLTLDETQNLLKYGRATPLYPKVQRDSVIIFGLLNNFKLRDVDEALNDMGLEMIGRYKA